MAHVVSQFQNYVSLLWFYAPIGIIGVWRWAVWIIKKIIGLFYKVQKNNFKASVSIIIPVYNENPIVFKKALSSWKANRPFEIIAVIDYSDISSIEIFKKFARSNSNAQLIITEKPGKRAALVDGIQIAKGEIVALVDSDTIWSLHVLNDALPPFIDPHVAGVTTRQNVLHPKTLAQRLFDIQLDSRYFDEYPFLGAAGDALVCLSGRTAFYRRAVILPMCHDLEHETFMGKKVISGDDKRLTYLVLEQGWKVAYQKNARVFTPGMATMKSYMKQRLRWTRNSLRADSRALLSGWPFRYPALAFFQIDKIIQSFTLILSPIYFLVSLYYGLYMGAFLIFTWWFVSRAIKMYPHLQRRPRDLSLLPFFVLFTFFSAILKIYAMFTLNTQGWITRWDKSRLIKLTALQYIPAYAMTCLVFVLLGSLVLNFKQGELNTILPNKKTAVLGAKTDSMKNYNSYSNYESVSHFFQNILDAFPNWNISDTCTRTPFPFVVHFSYHDKSYCSLVYNP
jgi:cellulose synthase/poly-beta-1,6-N-acetylglucosamine synthase-like glycosyltransferase